MARFLTIAVLLLAAFFYVLTQIPFFDRHLIAPYTSLVAGSMTVLLRVLGLSPVASGTQIYADGFTAVIVRECGGLEVMALLTAVILAFPAPFLHRWTGVIWGLGALYLINVARLVVLFLVGIHDRSNFAQAHYYYAQGFLLLAAVGVWALWVSRLPKHEFKNAH